MCGESEPLTFWVFRIPGKSENPDVPNFRKIRVSGFSGKSGNPDVPDFRNRGFRKIPDITLTALIVLGIISDAGIHYNYSINCAMN